MNEDKHAALQKSLHKLILQCIWSEARCDTLTAMVAFLAKKAGVSAQETANAIEKVSKVAFQKKLEQTEEIDPSLAAKLDPRPEQLDIDEFLP